MTLRKYILFLTSIACLGTLSSCGDDDNGTEEQSFTDNDFKLEGRWELKNNTSEEHDSDSIFVFNSDGSGHTENMRFTWHTHDDQLLVTADDGKKIKTFYSVSGASLFIQGMGTYVTQLPVTGAWYAAGAMSEFKGGTFCYYFNENGSGLTYSFDYLGLTAKTTFKWNRARNGVSIEYRYVTENKTCVISDSSMDIEGEGMYTSEPLFYGSWKAVDSNSGLVSKGDDNYSEIEISKAHESSYFCCSYKDEDTLCDKVFQGRITFSTSHQEFYDDQQIFIIQGADGGDAHVLDYRFFYYPPRKKVYLDLCEASKFKTFVRYELIK